ncbi:MAG: hypothetical protein RIE56_00715, partial [Amphiplicatus sp.]
MKRTLYLFAFVSIAFSAIACSTEANQKPAVAASTKVASMGQCKAGGGTEDAGVANLPYARGEIFY